MPLPELAAWVLMADRRNLWARLYDEAQDSDPLLALAAIKRIKNIFWRWENKAVKSALTAGREHGEARSDTLRQIAQASGNRGWELKADRLDGGERPFPAEAFDEIQRVLVRAGFSEIESQVLAAKLRWEASRGYRAPLDPETPTAKQRRAGAGRNGSAEPLSPSV